MDKSLINNKTIPVSTFESLKTAKARELRESTDAFEAFYYNKMLNVAYKDVDIMGEGPGNEIYKSMYLDELSKSSGGQLGLSKMMFDHLAQQVGGKI